MPEAPIDEERDAVPGEHEVWCAPLGQTRVKAEPEASRVKRAP